YPPATTVIYTRSLHDALPIYHLATLDQAMFVRLVVWPGIVQRADMVPHQHIALGPLVRVLIFLLQLMGCEQGQQPVALGLIHFVDPYGVARIAVQHLAPSDGMGQEHRVYRGWPFGTLLGRQVRAVAARPRTHVLPELVEVMRGRGVL